MASDKVDVLMLGPQMPLVVNGIASAFSLHKLWEAPDRDALIAKLAPGLKAIAAGGGSHQPVDGAFMAKFPKLEIVSSMGVGYDHIDAKWAGDHGITVTNTPDVLTEEVADTALGLLLCTVRQLPQAERHLRAGKWLQGAYPLTVSTLRDRSVGIVGLGRIGKAIGRRIEAFGMPIAYHGRNKQPDVSYRYYPNLVEMARDVDTLVVITPGGPSTKNLIDMQVLEALGPNGILINVARGSVVDEPALITALKEKKILSAGLDVFADEPRVPKELIEMEHVVLFPHVASASVYTRNAMGQLVVDNLLAWASGKKPLTPVAETPWPPKTK
ncbi:MAG TPA: 2-hydroxyacid dehydrogenase [Xanthobacteraceae bacterium]|jgi:lactate dehydrogenase-like 2-hydroxyacid dehydrogenase|nr:2-hydroxyacid dehydrogenase [Xanthobacteraceae bacterium]